MAGVIRLAAHPTIGGGHINMDRASAFGDDPDALLRFIELMPVSTQEVLSDANFLPVATARRLIEAKLGPLTPKPDFKTNGPATYYEVPGSGQHVGFTGLRVHRARGRAGSRPPLSRNRGGPGGSTRA